MGDLVCGTNQQDGSCPTTLKGQRFEAVGEKLNDSVSDPVLDCVALRKMFCPKQPITGNLVFHYITIMGEVRFCILVEKQL